MLLHLQLLNGLSGCLLFSFPCSFQIPHLKKNTIHSWRFFSSMSWYAANKGLHLLAAIFSLTVAHLVTVVPLPGAFLLLQLLPELGHRHPQFPLPCGARLLRRHLALREPVKHFCGISRTRLAGWLAQNFCSVSTNWLNIHSC